MQDATAFDAWQSDLNGICGHYFGAPHAGRAGVRGRVRPRRLCGMDLADISGDVAAIRRDRAGIRRDEAEHVFALFQLSGGLRVRHNGHRTRLRPGEGLLLDSTKEAELGFAEGGARFVSLHMPRQAFLDADAGRVRIGETMAADHPMSDPIRRQVRLLLSGAGGAGEAVSPASAPLLLGMIRLGFAAPGDAAPDPVPEADRFGHAVRLIEANLARPDLTCAWLARRMGLSVRHLQRIFQDRGAHVSGVVRDRRLARAAARLARAAGRGDLRVAEIAFAAGFRDPTSFARAFKAAYGLPPRDYAARAAESRHPG